MQLPRTVGEWSAVRVSFSQDIKGGSCRRRRWHGAGGWVAGAAAAVCGGGSTAGSPTNMATVLTILWSPTAVFDKAEVAASYALKSSPRTT